MKKLNLDIENFKKIIINSNFSHLSEEVLQEFLSTVEEGFESLFYVTLEEQLDENQLQELSKLDDEDSIKFYLANLGIDLELIATDTANTILEVVKENLVKSESYLKGYIDGQNQQK